MLKNNKKGVSEMVSYVLLIVIAVGLASGVYYYLKIYVPSEKRIECPTGISLYASEIICNLNNSVLSVEFENSGLFNVSGAYVRMGAQNRTVKTNLNRGGVFIFDGVDLAPGQSFIFSENAGSIVNSPGTYNVDIQPAVVTKNGLAICAVSEYKVNCK